MCVEPGLSDLPRDMVLAHEHRKSIRQISFSLTPYEAPNSQATMQSGARLIAPLEVVPYRASSARYVCSTCRRQFLPRCTSQSLFSRRHNSSDSNNNNSGSLPFSEKVRRKIWGTDNPPGLKDPYGGESFLEKRLREKREAKAAEEAQREPELEYVAEEQLTAASEAPTAEPTEYVPATTWDSLEHVGTSGKWWEYPPTPADQFAAYVTLSFHGSQLLLGQ